MRISKYDNISGEPFSGYIICNNMRYYIRRGILILIPPTRITTCNKLRGLYEALPPAPWKAFKNEFVRHMRLSHLRLIKECLSFILEKNNESKIVSILAIGCGWGWELWATKFLIDSMNNHRYLLLGIDIAGKPIKYGRKLIVGRGIENMDLAISPAEKLPFKSESFDLILGIFGALDHSRAYFRIFKEVNRVLKRKGVFGFTVLNKFALDWMLKVISKPKLFIKTLIKAKEPFTRVTIPLPKGGRVRIPTHYYNPIEVKKILRLSGFKLIKAFSIFSLLLMNFKRSKLNRLEKVLSKLELLLCEKPFFRYIGRYISIIARKA